VLRRMEGAGVVFWKGAGSSGEVHGILQWTALVVFCLVYVSGGCAHDAMKR
jgi:hypothetical protein